jgi:hypothetical protein
MNAFHRPYWGEPRYVFDGATVWLPLSCDDATGRARAARCKVVCAAGNHARIVSGTRFGIDRWVRLDALLVPPDDPRHWNQVLGDST